MKPFVGIIWTDDSRTYHKPVNNWMDIVYPDGMGYGEPDYEDILYREDWEKLLPERLPTASELVHWITIID